MMFIENKFNHGQIVYLKTDLEQKPRIVSRFTVMPSGQISYALGCGVEESWHYDFEISEEKEVLTTL